MIVELFVLFFVFCFSPEIPLFEENSGLSFKKSCYFMLCDCNSSIPGSHCN